MIVYHGSDKVVETPLCGKGKGTNDFSIGFYVTESEQIAGEWAGRRYGPGACVLNKYELNLEGLDIPELGEEDLLQWVAIILYNRTPEVCPMLTKEEQWLLDHKTFRTHEHDCILGWRADDFVWQYVKKFIDNEITTSQLIKIIELAGLGKQYVLKSRKAFSQLKFLEHVDLDYELWHAFDMQREAFVVRDINNLVLPYTGHGTTLGELIAMSRLTQK